MSKLKALWLSIFILCSGLPHLQGQNANALYQKYKEELSLKDPIQRDSVSIRNYAAYAIYQVQDRIEGAEKMVDSLAMLTSTSDWSKAHGIFLRVKARHVELEDNMDEALRLYDQAVDSLRSCGPDYQDLSAALIGQGFVLLNTGLTEQAFQTLKEGYRYAELAGHLKSRILTLNFFGDYYYYSAFGQQQFDSALHYYLKTEDLIQENGWKGYFKADNHLGLANVYRRIEDDKTSEQYFQSSLEEAEAFSNYGVIYALYVDKAEVFEEKKQFRKALELKLKAYDYVKASGRLEFMARADNHLYQTYKSLGNFEEALSYYEKYNAAQDSMKKEEATARYAELEAKYENKQKEEEIYRLKSKNLKQARDYFLLLTVIGIVLVVLISRLNWSLRKKNSELEKKNEQILLAQLEGQNMERKRMSLELHDNLNTKIAAIRWQLEAIKPSMEGKPQKVLEKSLDLIDDVYSDVRLISHNLMPEKVESLGLINAIKNLLTQLEQNNKVAFHLVVNTQPDLQFGSLNYPIYNIIFEMINNILKHAEAENCWISISEDEENILLTVSDDGKGFDIDKMTSGHGIKNIISRLETIHGKWNIESAPEKGTKFFIEIPKISAPA